MIRNGTEHMARLRDGRTVFIDGAQVDDVTTHPAYRNAIRSIAWMFDFHADPGNQELMTFVAPESGETHVAAADFVRRACHAPPGAGGQDRAAQLHRPYAGPRSLRPATMHRG